MTEENRNLYEGMFIVSSTLTEETREKVMEKVQKLITDQGGEIHNQIPMGRKRLSYQIERHKEGHYFVLYFSVKPAALTELWREFHLMEDLVRFMTMRAEKVAESLEFKTIENATTR